MHKNVTKGTLLILIQYWIQGLSVYCIFASPKWVRKQMTVAKHKVSLPVSFLETQLHAIQKWVL